MREKPPHTRRLWMFVGLCIAAMLLAGAYTARAIWSGPRASVPSNETAVRLSAPPPRPYLIVRSTVSD
ncbi:MAG: hypothetical protein ACRD3C_07180, partial [Vicinamibacterales bacterium]